MGLDANLFACNPARDERFTVKDRWIECANLPGEHPLHLVEFFHRQMNEEINSLESSAQNLTDFPETDWELRMWLARQCADEARHARMFRRMLEERGGHIGQFPVLNFQYRIITACENLAGRLAVQNRSFEAGGIDAIAFGIRESKVQRDAELAELYEAQLADEITHVRFANDWIKASVQKDPKTVLRIGAALTAASKAFHQVMGPEGTEGASYPADGAARREAGFSDAEVGLAVQLQTNAAGASPADTLRRG